DFLHPFEFITFMRAASSLTCDVMLEAKAKDVALIRLRRDLARYAPDIAARFGIAPEIAQGTEGDLSSIREPIEAGT
nr:UV DNA damage repair endonuclease UvsE [Chloroflexota bacterium]